MNKKIAFALASGTFLVGIVLVGVWGYFRSAPVYKSGLVHQEVEQVAQLLARIDADCNVLSIRSGCNKIDFLNVISFAGSQVGPLNLMHPKKWRGPYINDNPVFDGKLYELAETIHGYFVVPGLGARLPNGLVMGKDIILRPTTNIPAMVQPGGALHHDGYAFAHKLEFVVGDWGAVKKAEPSAEQVSREIDHSDIVEQPARTIHFV